MQKTPKCDGQSAEEITIFGAHSLHNHRLSKNSSRSFPQFCNCR